MPKVKSFLTKTLPIVVLLSVLPFVMLEAFLWAIGYQGKQECNYTTYARAFDENGGSLVQAMGRKDLHQAPLAMAKPPNTVRVFVFGGSVAVGYEGSEKLLPPGVPMFLPNPYSQILEDHLNQNIDNTNAEVSNLAEPGLGTYRILPILKDSLKYAPDYVVVDAGNNEFVEGLLHETWVQSQTLRLCKTLVWAANLRYKSASVKFGNWAGATPEQFVTGEAKGEELLERARRNLLEIVTLCRNAGVPLVFAINASNLRYAGEGGGVASQDLAPEQRSVLANTSHDCEEALHEKRYADAVAVLDKALPRLPTKNVPEMEHMWFLQGRAYDGLGDFERAKVSFTRAKDLMPVNVRAPSALNEFIRSLAEPGRVLVVDTERLFESAMPDGIPDARIFCDGCHPRPEGHAIIAAALEAAIEQHAGLPVKADPAAVIAAYRESIKNEPIVYTYADRKEPK
jgi:tetratricopeptide (TPR) repeat protein